MAKRQFIGSENTVGQNIVRIRKAKGIRQFMLLARVQVRGLDIPQNVLADIEGQKRPVSSRELKVIADALGVAVEDLYSPEGPNKYPPA